MSAPLLHHHPALLLIYSTTVSFIKLVFEFCYILDTEPLTVCCRGCSSRTGGGGFVAVVHDDGDVLFLTTQEQAIQRLASWGNLAPRRPLIAIISYSFLALISTFLKTYAF